MKMNLNRKNLGFTLIELLVVVAIIGILASVVLASLNTARSKGKDASVQSSMSSMRAQAELGVGASGTYIDGICAATSTGGLDGLIKAVNNITDSDVVCGQNTAPGTAPAAWGAAVYLPSNGSTAGNVFCVDSTGFAGVKSAANLTPAIEINAGSDAVCDGA